MIRRSLLVTVVLCATAALAGALLARMVTRRPLVLASGTWLPQRQALAPFQLQDLAGRPFDRASLSGAPTLLFFGYTGCPDVCPTTLATLAQVQRHNPLPGTRVVFVTIDPQRDSAANLRAYLNAFSSHFIGLRGSAQALAPLLGSLDATAVRVTLPDGSYTMEHSATLYLIDPRGRLAAVFTPPFSAARLSMDLSRIAHADRL